MRLQKEFNIRIINAIIRKRNLIALEDIKLISHHTHISPSADADKGYTTHIWRLNVPTLFSV